MYIVNSAVCFTAIRECCVLSKLNFPKGLWLFILALWFEWIAIPLGYACFEISSNLWVIFLRLLFQPPAWNSRRRSLSAATVCCRWPLSSSTGAIWGLSGFLEGTTVLFVKGVERAAHSFSTLAHLQDYLPSNLTKKSSSKRVIPYHFCGYDTSNPTRRAYVCVCEYVHVFHGLLCSRSRVLQSALCVPLHSTF